MNEQGWKHLSVEELHKVYNDWQVVDIRDPMAWQRGHVPGASHLTNDNVQQMIEDLDFEKPLVVICYAGNSSKAAAQLMHENGFQDVYSLDGGMTLWQSLYPELIE